MKFLNKMDISSLISESTTDDIDTNIELNQYLNIHKRKIVMFSPKNE